MQEVRLRWSPDLPMPQFSQGKQMPQTQQQPQQQKHQQQQYKTRNESKITRVTLPSHPGGSEQRNSTGCGKYQLGLGTRLLDAANRTARQGAERRCRNCTS